MITVKIFGSTPPCAKCKKLKAVAKALAQKYPGKVEVVELPAMSPEGDKYGVVLTPTTVVNEKVIATGSIPSERDLEEVIKKEIGG